VDWVVKFLTSTIGRKLVLALSGLLLCGFLVVHLGGNLLMFVGPDAYNTYAHTLHSQEWLVKTAEVGLLLLFAAHIVIAINTDRDNRESRGRDYQIKDSKQASFLPWQLLAENWMIISGLIVLAFLIIHLADFTFEATPNLMEKIKGHEPFDKAMIILRNPFSAIIYVVGCLLLGWHLSHGFRSAFQSLGINHPKYTKAIENLGKVFALVIALGFASFPIWAAVSNYKVPDLSTNPPAAVSAQK
jgi:succinate dehydrogenase (or fumarate reductase) cytochrome b subunit, b558 family